MLTKLAKKWWHPAAEGCAGGQEIAPAVNTGETGGGEAAEKTVTLTQKDLDALIDRAFAKGARKGARHAVGISSGSETPHKGVNGEDGQNTVPVDQSTAHQEAETLMQKAQQMMLDAVMKSIADEVHLTDKGLGAAAKLAALDGCFCEDGQISEDAVRQALKDFAKEYPEFKKAGSEPAFLFEGNPKGGGEVNREAFAKMGYRERLELKKNNPELYKTLQ